MYIDKFSLKVLVICSVRPLVVSPTQSDFVAVRRTEGDHPRLQRNYENRGV